MKYIGSIVTDIGLQRKINQDSACLKIAEVKDKGQVAMAIVCDGMGGLQKGELASAEVIRTFAWWFDHTFPMILKDYTWDLLKDNWCEMIENLNIRLLEYGKKTNSQLGTTFSGILSIQEKYMIVHLGDSRIYSINNIMTQLTEDHTLVGKKVKMGLLTPEEAFIDCQRNILTQCIGASKHIKPQIIFGKNDRDTVYLLCSDGFTHVLASSEIFDAFHPSKVESIDYILQEAKHFIDMVKYRNEKDNITVTILKSIHE